MYLTNQNRVKIFNNKGTDIGNIPAKGTEVNVTGAQVTIPLRGAVFPVSYNKLTGYIMVGMLSFKPVAPPPVVEPPSSGEPKLYKMLRVMQAGSPNPLAEANRKGVGTPDIIVLKDGRVQFTKAWQMFLLKINPNMLPKHVAAIMGSGRWGFNRTGLPSERFPQRRANYIMSEDTDFPNPATDKIRTFTYNVHRGIQVGNEVILETMDGDEMPPDVTPQSHPHLFCHLTIVYPNERSITPFPNGAPAWGYQSAFTWFPLVSDGEVRVPLSQVREVQSYQLPYIPTRL